MGTVADRIEAAPACDVINLRESEKDLYHGTGWHLACFDGETLIQLYSPLKDVAFSPDREQMLDDLGQRIINYIETAKGEIWFAMCSCYQLCEPVAVSAPSGRYDARVLAKVVRCFVKELDEL